MKVIYYSHPGVFAAQVAGYIHLNILPSEFIPTTPQLVHHLRKLPSHHNNGVPLFMGMDNLSNEIFQINFGKERNLGLQTISFLLAEHSNLLDWKFFQIKIPRNVWLRLGDSLIKLKMRWWGIILIAIGIRRYYSLITERVKKTKELNKSLV